MSWRGRAVVRRLAEQESAAELDKAEIARIRSGNYDSLFRDIEPPIEAGDKRIVCSSPSLRYFDQALKETFDVPSEPTMWVILGQPIRKAKGGWSVPLLEIVDKRNRPRYIRRLPPVMSPRSKGDEQTAHRQSNYQSTPIGAVDELQSAEDEDLAVFSAEAQVKRALADHENVGEKLAAIRHLPPRRRTVELLKLADDRGVDLRDDLRAFERRLQRRLGDAA